LDSIMRRGLLNITLRILSNNGQWA
jgi:hypothetical protein